ncbi:polymer-forming cytoskeletal protein [Shewanella cyperi]|uniref:Polymer-forming cytoskeletal protein n=1 Tax=Shewanella cyperi TaxID=2814292 RepID=A0A974XJ93_9GAMM|nr:polymer-forming cytoskeletal protein [Shewanella cyperi]QSX29389.1 polymer-forming cytoskeletal protein [Shewanella cyperi]
MSENGSKNKGVTYISPGTLLDGEIQLDSSALVAGKLKGKVRAAGLLMIETGGEIQGELCCQELRVNGQFNGKLSCNRLVVQAGGLVNAEVACNSMEIVEGGQFIGSRSQGPDPESLPVADTPCPDPTARTGSSAPALKILAGMALMAALGYGVQQDVLGDIGAALSQTEATATQPQVEAALVAPLPKSQPQAAQRQVEDEPQAETLSQSLIINAEAQLEPASDETMSKDIAFEDQQAMDAANTLLLQMGQADAGQEQSSQLE